MTGGCLKVKSKHVLIMVLLPLSGDIVCTTAALLYCHYMTVYSNACPSMPYVKSQKFNDVPI